jgi:hypothetical protein
MQPYEVWCHTCNVTFPAETRACLHCGGRTRPGRPRSTLRRGGEVEAFAPTITFGNETAGSLPFDEPSDASVEEAEPRRSLLRAGMTVLWMVLLAAGYAWRACSQN